MPRPRVAIVGSGPAGFYLADFLLKSGDPPIAVDMYERLPAPFGLVRYGVAPDHQSIKRAATPFQRTATHASFRYFGNVEVGVAVSVEELRAHYHAVAFAYGSATDKHMGIAGEELRGSFAATAFVGWYNGHPDFIDYQFDLDAERAVVVGVGNVAMDVARILVRDPNELASTDITQYALQALQRSRVREVVVLGRRGPAQAAFDLGELKDIAELPGVTLSVDGPLPEVDPTELDAAQRRTMEFLAALPQTPGGSETRRVRLRFLASPVEILGDGERVVGLRIEHNELQNRGGKIVARGTGKFEELTAGIVVRSIGYQGTALPGAPFDASRGVIPNEFGRVLDESGQQLPGLYTAGWIKRGPTGLVGTNKGCARETYEAMVKDLAVWSQREVKDPADLLRTMQQRGVRPIVFPEWQRLDSREVALGKQSGKVREKFLSLSAMLQALSE